MYRPNAAAIVLSTVLAVAGTACAARTGERISIPATSRTLAPSIYYEDGRSLFLGVNTGLARFGAQQDLVPVEIAVANKDLPKLTVNLEGITLQADGQRWPAAAVEERAGSTLRADFERRTQPVSFRAALRTRFPIYREIQPNAGGTPRDRSLAREVELGQHTWVLAQVWFPHPGGELKGRTFEVWLQAPELEDPVFATVRF
jgi:hypothetical protein